MPVSNENNTAIKISMMAVKLLSFSIYEITSANTVSLISFF